MDDDGMTELSDLIFDSGERSVPCEACDCEGVVTLERVSDLEHDEDLKAVCRACDGWGWREP